MNARRVAIGLGANLGSREAALRFAVDMLRDDEQVEIESLSPIYSTPPVGPPQPEYLNAALTLRTELPPSELLPRLHQIEDLAGRDRGGERWGPRTLDLDLLYWDGEPLSLDSLELPHPHLHERSFALAPLLDVWPQLSERYGNSLERTGGVLQEVGHLATSPSVTVHEGLVRATGQTLADAAVFALDEAFACFTSEPTSVRELEPLVPMRFMARAIARVAEGFVPWRTLISSFDAKQVVGRMVGQKAEPTAFRLEWVRFCLEPVSVELRISSSSDEPQD